MSATSHPLFDRLVHDFDAQWLGQGDLDGFLAQSGEQVILLAGNPVRFPEGLDVAVVLPELQRHFQASWRLAIARSDSEDAIARRYGAQQWPSMIYLRDGAYVGVVAGMQDWDVYVQRFEQLRQQEPSRAPSIGIPLVVSGAAAASACSHS